MLSPESPCGSMGARNTLQAAWFATVFPLSQKKSILMIQGWMRGSQLKCPVGCDGKSQGQFTQNHAQA